MKGNFYLKNNEDFRKVYNRKNTSGNRNFTLYRKKNNLNIVRIGISINKKVGIAVVRNRIKRQIKALYTKHYNSIKTGHDIVFVVKTNVAEISYAQLESAFLHILKISNLLKDQK